MDKKDRILSLFDLTEKRGQINLKRLFSRALLIELFN